MFHRDVFVVFHFECLLLERKEHDPTTFPQFSSAYSKGEDLKGRDGEDTHTPQKMSLFYLSSVAGFMSLAVLSLSCICNNKV